MRAKLIDKVIKKEVFNVSLTLINRTLTVKSMGYSNFEA
jgi:hypothetical protein